MLSGVVSEVVQGEVFLNRLSGPALTAPPVIRGRGTFSIMATVENTARRLERRWAPRYSYDADIEIEWGSAVLRARTRDISANGMFIESPDPLWVGAGFTARLSAEKSFRMDCTVKRIEPGKGMGVSMTLPETQNQKHFQNLLTYLSRART